MESKPKILIIDNSLDTTGALRAIVQVCCALQAHFRFSFVIPHHSKGRAMLVSNGFSQIYELPMLELSKSAWSWICYLPRLLKNTLRIRKIINLEGAALIHVNDVYNLLATANRILGGRTPYICHIRFLPHRFPRLLFETWVNLHARYSAQIVVVSKAVSNSLPNGIRSKIIYDGVDFGRQMIRNDNEVAPKAFYTFLYLSNFMKGKGQNFAIEAFAKASDELPQWKLRFVGGDMGIAKNANFRRQLQRQAHELGISKKVEWNGFTADVEKEYMRADVVLNFSESESFSFTCLEALHLGKPVIATDSGGPGEIIENNISGIIVPTKDVDAMANAMIKLATDRQLRKSYAVNGALRARSIFNFSTTVDHFFSLYTKLIR